MPSSSSSSGGSGSASPVSTAYTPRTISTSPAAPASTTPASFSTGSISRVCATISSPAATISGRSAAALGRVGQLADRGQHRPLDRLLDGAVRGVARRAESLGEVVALGERLGRAADDLRQDHARVAARAHQRRARDLVREACAIVGAVLLQRLVDRAHGQREVRAGVAVGDRDRRSGRRCGGGAPRSRRARRRPARACALSEAPRAYAAHALARTRWMTTSTAETERPVRRSTS